MLNSDVDTSTNFGAEFSAVNEPGSGAELGPGLAESYCSYW